MVGVKHALEAPESPKVKGATKHHRWFYMCCIVREEVRVQHTTHVLNALKMGVGCVCASVSVSAPVCLNVLNAEVSWMGSTGFTVAFAESKSQSCLYPHLQRRKLNFCRQWKLFRILCRKESLQHERVTVVWCCLCLKMCQDVSRCVKMCHALSRCGKIC